MLETFFGYAALWLGWTIVFGIVISIITVTKEEDRKEGGGEKDGKEIIGSFVLGGMISLAIVLIIIGSRIVF